MRSDFETELSKIQRQRDRLGAKYTAEVEELRVNLATAERRLAEAEGKSVLLLSVKSVVDGERLIFNGIVFQRPRCRQLCGRIELLRKQQRPPYVRQTDLG